MKKSYVYLTIAVILFLTAPAAVSASCLTATGGRPEVFNAAQLTIFAPITASVYEANLVPLAQSYRNKEAQTAVIVPPSSISSLLPSERAAVEEKRMFGFTEKEIETTEQELGPAQPVRVTTLRAPLTDRAMSARITGIVYDGIYYFLDLQYWILTGDRYLPYAENLYKLPTPYGSTAHPDRPGVAGGKLNREFYRNNSNREGRFQARPLGVANGADVLPFEVGHQPRTTLVGTWELTDQFLILRLHFFP